MKVALQGESDQVDIMAGSTTGGKSSTNLISKDSPSETFIFDSKIDELTTKLQQRLELNEESSPAPDEYSEPEMELISGRRIKMEPSHHPITSSRSLSIAAEEMELGDKHYPIPPPSPGAGKKRDWKIPRFLRRTQSATEEEEGHLALMGSRGSAGSGAVGGSGNTGNVFFSSKNKDNDRCRTASGSKLIPCDPSAHSVCDRPRSSSEIDKETGTKWRTKGMEMKFGLGFLKRRHTEGQISPPSVRPPPEEAKKWSESFQNLMISKYGQCLFKAFLRREFSHENIEFWIAVEQYRKARERKLPAKAQKIINEFVLSQAPREVNLDSVTKDVLINTTSFSQPDYNTFDQAQKKIQSILEADAYIRFLQSDLYLELIYPERYSSTSPDSPEKPNGSKTFEKESSRKQIPKHADSTE